jgi:hypothetical protein
MLRTDLIFLPRSRAYLRQKCLKFMFWLVLPVRAQECPMTIPACALASTCTTCDSKLLRDRACVELNCPCTNCTLQGIPTAVNASSQIYSICDEMPMKDCICPAPVNGVSNCNTLKVYSDLCLDMPDMRQCQQWKQFCSVYPKTSYCGSSDQKEKNGQLPLDMISALLLMLVL